MRENLCRIARLYDVRVALGLLQRNVCFRYLPVSESTMMLMGHLQLVFTLQLSVEYTASVVAYRICAVRVLGRICFRNTSACHPGLSHVVSYAPASWRLRAEGSDCVAGRCRRINV